ncbi:ABC transporter substrate-binding protein [Paenarthrobacter histidinolovorans]|uniref:ABC transporter substrate-binding protein n=1 Tax=Paenarthrobacter histidinolovorans TaxID=43664 RepID=UPI001665E5A8|nr:ABC transporter substrate-binding protein [Paenarthrobacter histidinolovorans]
MKKLMAAVAAVAMASTLAACSGNEAAPTPTAAEKLTVGYPTDITGRNVDPALTVGGSAAPFLYSVYDTLFKFDQDGVPQPNLASKSELSADGKTMTLTIKEGVKFQDGSPLTAKDVVFSIDRSRGADATLKGPTQASSLAAVAAVSSPDDKTVVISMKQPNPILPNVLAYFPGMVVPAAYIAKVGNDGFLKAPIGSGPYKLTSATQGQSLELAAFADYTGSPKPAYKDVTLKVLTDGSARLAALRSGGIDFAVDVDVTQSASLESSGFTVKGNRAGARLSVLLNGKTPGLSDPKVSRAFNMAVNIEAIRDSLFSGKATLASTIDPTVSVDKIEPYKQNVEEAKKLLDEAKFDRSRTLILDYPAGNFPQGELIVQAVQSDLAAVGVKVDLRPMDTNTWSEKLQSKSLDDLSLFRSRNTTYDSFQSINDAFTCSGPYSMWCDPKLDEQLVGLSTKGGAERVSGFLDFNKAVHENPPSIFLVDPDQICAMKKGIEWQATPGTTNFTFAQIQPVS